MRAHGLLSPAPRASGRREDPRREGHHPGAQRDVGDGRRAGIHARRRVGLDLRGSRTLERGVRGVARVQSRESLRGTRSDLRTGSNVSMVRWTPMSPAGWRFGMDHGSQYLSDHFLKQIRYWGIHPSFGFVEEPENERGGGAVESHAQGASDPRPNLSEPSRPSASPWPTSWSGTTRPGVSRSLGITRRSRRARSMCYARRP